MKKKAKGICCASFFCKTLQKRFSSETFSLVIVQRETLSDGQTNVIGQWTGTSLD